MMKKTCLLMLCAGAVSYGQVGINSETPDATLEIVAKNNTATNKIIEINDNDNVQNMAVYDNGNLEFRGALMPNNNPGEKGEYLISQGAETAPEWKAIIPSQTKQIFDVFQGNQVQSESYPILNNSANTWIRPNISNVNINESSVGAWLANEFIVKKTGVYIVSFNLRMYTGTTSANDYTSFARITMGSNAYQFPTDGFEGDGNVYWNAGAGEIVGQLNVGDKIFISAYNSVKWSLEAVSLQIKYVEL